jgi:hypothetical protein
MPKQGAKKKARLTPGLDAYSTLYLNLASISAGNISRAGRQIARSQE